MNEKKGRGGKKVIIHRRVAEDAKRMNIFLSADPRGIGSAFHRAEEGGKQKDALRVGLIPVTLPRQ